LKKSLISGTFLSDILVAAMVGEEEVVGVALHPRVTLGVVASGLVGDGKIVSSFYGHGVRNGSSAASSEKLEGKRMGSDGTGRTHRCSVLYVQQAIV
jgi:hypothetical protein